MVLFGYLWFAGLHLLLSWRRRRNRCILLVVREAWQVAHGLIVSSSRHLLSLLCLQLCVHALCQRCRLVLFARADAAGYSRRLRDQRRLRRLVLWPRHVCIGRQPCHLPMRAKKRYTKMCGFRSSSFTESGGGGLAAIAAVSPLVACSACSAAVTTASLVVVAPMSVQTKIIWRHFELWDPHTPSILTKATRSFSPNLKCFASRTFFSVCSSLTAQRHAQQAQVAACQARAREA